MKRLLFRAIEINKIENIQTKIILRLRETKYLGTTSLVLSDCQQVYVVLVWGNNRMMYMNYYWFIILFGKDNNFGTRGEKIFIMATILLLLSPFPNTIYSTEMNGLWINRKYFQVLFSLTWKDYLINYSYINKNLRVA